MSSTSMSTASFLWLSDIHLDPYYGEEGAASVASRCSNVSIEERPLGSFGCDSPRHLVDSAMEFAHSLGRKENGNGNDNGNSDVEFYLVTGDFCRHGTDQLIDPMQETQRILSEVSVPLSNQIGTLSSITGRDISVIPSIGNNDVTPDYYLDTCTNFNSSTTASTTSSSTRTNPMLETVTNGLLPLFNNVAGEGTETETETLRKGGYFVRNIGDRMTILSLNTVIYSIKHLPPNCNDPDPFGQFHWMEQQLQIVSDSGRYVYVTGHIPPTLGSYRHSQLWGESYLMRYYDIVGRYRRVIKGQFYGHLHSDEFRIPDITSIMKERKGENNDSNGAEGSEDHDDDDDNDDVDDGLVLWLASSITPIYGSNPSIRQVHYEVETGTVLDYDTYYLNLTDPQIQKDWYQNNHHQHGMNDNDNFNYWLKGPSFKESFGVQDMSRESLQRGIMNAMESDLHSPLWDVLLMRQHIYANEGEYVGKDSAAICDTGCQAKWICTLSSITSGQYQKCLAMKDRNRNRGGGLSGGGGMVPIILVVAVGLIMMIILLTWRYWGISPIQFWRRRITYHRTGKTSMMGEEHHDSDSLDQGQGNPQEYGSTTEMELNSATTLPASIPEIT